MSKSTEMLHGVIDRLIDQMSTAYPFLEEYLPQLRLALDSLKVMYKLEVEAGRSAD